MGIFAKERSEYLFNSWDFKKSTLRKQKNFIIIPKHSAMNAVFASRMLQIK